MLVSIAKTVMIAINVGFEASTVPIAMSVLMANMITIAMSVLIVRAVTIAINVGLDGQ